MWHRYIFSLIVFWVFVSQLALAGTGLIEKTQQLEQRVGALESANISNEKAKIFFVKGDSKNQSTGMCRKISNASNIFCSLEKNFTIKEQSLLTAFAQAKIRKNRNHTDIYPQFILYELKNNKNTLVPEFGSQTFNLTDFEWGKRFESLLLHDVMIIDPGTYELYVKSQLNDNTALVGAYDIFNEYMKIVILPIE